VLPDGPVITTGAGVVEDAFPVVLVLLAVLLDPDGVLEATVVGVEEDAFPVVLVLLTVLLDPDGVLEATVVGVEEDAFPVVPVLLAVLLDPDGVLEATVVDVEEDAFPVVPVLLAVLLDPDGVLEAVLDDDGAVIFLSEARSARYSFTFLAISLTNAVLSATSFLISDLIRATTAFCCFCKSGITDFIALMAFLSCAIATLFPGLFRMFERRSAWSFMSISRIRSSLASDRCNANLFFRISILRSVEIFRSRTMSFLSARISAFMTLTEELAEVPVVVEEDDAGVVLPVLLAVFVDPEELPLEDAPAEVVVLPDDEEEVEDVPDAVVDGVPTVSVGTLVPEEEPVEAAKVFRGDENSH
jgi:hypothetical protein